MSEPVAPTPDKRVYPVKRYFVLAQNGTPTMMCRRDQVETNGTIRFYVMNGNWDGNLTDGIITVAKYPDMTCSVDIVWESDTPADYDEVFAALEAKGKPL